MHDSATRHLVLIAGLKIFDIAAMTVCFVVAAILASPDVSFDVFTLRLGVIDVFLFAGIIMLWEMLFGAFGLYSDLLRSRPATLAVELLKAITIGTGIWVLFALLLHDDVLNFRFIAIFWVGTFLLSWGIRASTLGILRRTIARENSRPTFLIVGVNSRSLELAESIEVNPATAHRLIGFVDVGEMPPGDDESRQELLTDVDGLQAFLRHTPVDEVLVCLPLKSHYDTAARVVSICEEQGITAKILADFFQTRMTHSRTEAFGDYSVITVATHEMTGIPALIKRSFDIIASAALLTLLSPLLFAVAILVGGTSHGPILFAQERVGLNKKIFRMLKFRTMVVDAEIRQAALESLNEAEGPAFKIRNDPRITAVGRILRKASLDELPQLLNVIKGDMSLVGPRPLPLRDYAGFQEDWHRRRLSVRPGITGLWQVKDRDHTSFDVWMKLDMQYINQWSLMLDFKILLETIPAVLRGSGE